MFWLVMVIENIVLFCLIDMVMIEFVVLNLMVLFSRFISVCISKCGLFCMVVLMLVIMCIFIW